MNKGERDKESEELACETGLLNANHWPNNPGHGVNDHDVVVQKREGVDRC